MPLVAMTPHGMDAGKKPVASVLLETTDGQVTPCTVIESPPCPGSTRERAGRRLGLVSFDTDPNRALSCPSGI